MAQIKDQRLLVMPVASDTKIGGAPISTTALKITDTKGYRYSAAARDGSFTAVVATWQDHDTATRKSVIAGAADGDSSTKTLKAAYPTEAQAQAAASAELARLGRGAAELTLDLVRGDPSIIANSRLTLSGFKAVIDATEWMIDSVTHTISSGGFVTAIAAKCT
jgi:hypothetical protein